MNGRVNNSDAGDLRHHHDHYDDTVMIASRFYFCGIIIMWLSCRNDVWLLRWNKHPYVVFCCVVNILTVSTADHNRKLYFWHPKARVVESSLGQYTDSMSYFTRADSRLAPSQWETSLRSNVKVSHWLGTNLYSEKEKILNSNFAT